MKTKLLSGMVAFLSLQLLGSPLFAQKLHVNDRWDECAIVIDPSLSQQAWHQFVSEVGSVIYFRPIAPANPLRRKHFDVAVMDWGTRIDDADAAWNDTFSHPDSTHWLFDGSALFIPGLMFRMGVTDRIDIGAYFTKSFGANYGFLGGQLQYNLFEDKERKLAAAGRISAVGLFGPEDLKASVYGLDVLVSKNLSVFSPYIGVSGYLSHGKETTTKVNLDNENVFGLQGTVGMAINISKVRFGGEFNLARVPGYYFKVGFGS